MALSKHQEEVQDKIVALIKEGENRIILKGSAGVGKTYLAAESIKLFKSDRELNPNYNNGHVYVTAPTNKALAVLQSKIDTPVDFKTIHSACKLYQYIDRKTGIATFVRQKWTGKRQGDEFDQCRIAIIDECSMLNSDFLGRTVVIDNKEVYIPGYLEDFRFPIIFMGDGKQLNPVGEEISPIWVKGYPEVELTEIIRQGEGNPIIDLSRDLDLIYFKIPSIINGKGYTYSNDRTQFIEDLAESNGTDELKYLAYTNKEVDAMNINVRQRRYGTPKRIEVGETIVFNTPLGNFYTNKEVKVEEVDIITSYIDIPRYETKFDNSNEPIGRMDNIKIKYYRVNGAFNVVHEHFDVIYRSIYDSLKENNKRHAWDGRAYHYFAGQFADITYNHAITIHKSQGSTYKQVIINVGNVLFNKKIEERNRMLYTAITRASDLVILYNVT